MASQRQVLMADGKISLLRMLTAKKGEYMYDPIVSTIVKNKKERHQLKLLIETYEAQIEFIENLLKENKN